MFIYKDGKRQSNSYYILGNINKNILVASVEKQNYGVLNSVGEVVIPVVYSKLKSLNDDLFIATDKSDKMGVINIDNREIVPFKYDVIKSLKEDLEADMIIGQYGRSEKDFDFFM